MLVVEHELMGPMKPQLGSPAPNEMTHQYLLWWKLLKFAFLLKFQLEQQVTYSDFQRKVHDIVNQINPDAIQNERTWRQLRYLATIGPTALPPDQLDRVS